MERAKHKRTVTKTKKEIVENMSTLGTYKQEYNATVEILAKILVDLEDAENEFFESGGALIIEYTNKAGATNNIKNPFYAIIESLRQSAIIYARELGLTPAGLKKINENKKSAAPEKKKSATNKILSMYG